MNNKKAATRETYTQDVKSCMSVLGLGTKDHDISSDHDAAANENNKHNNNDDDDEDDDDDDDNNIKQNTKQCSRLQEVGIWSQANVSCISFFSRFWCWRMVVLQLSGCYCNSNYNGGHDTWRLQGNSFLGSIL